MVNVRVESWANKWSRDQPPVLVCSQAVAIDDSQISSITAMSQDMAPSSDCIIPVWGTSEVNKTIYTYSNIYI